MKGWHFIAVDLVHGWEGYWLDELLAWPARYEKWRAGAGITGKVDEPRP